MILEHISLPIFMTSLAIGLFFIYILGPEIKTIYVYPSPENVHEILFKDNADNCFFLNPVEVDCPTDESQLGSIPIQV